MLRAPFLRKRQTNNPNHRGGPCVTVYDLKIWGKMSVNREWLNKLWSIPTMEYYTVTKRNE